MDRERACESEGTGKKEKRRGEVSRGSLQLPDDDRPDKAAAIADGVDKGEPSCRAGAGQDGGRQRPEGPERRMRAKRRERKRDEDERKRLRERRPGESASSNEERDRHMQDALSGAIGIPSGENHSDGGNNQQQQDQFRGTFDQGQGQGGQGGDRSAPYYGHGGSGSGRDGVLPQADADKQKPENVQPKDLSTLQAERDSFRARLSQITDQASPEYLQLMGELQLRDYLLMINRGN